MRIDLQAVQQRKLVWQLENKENPTKLTPLGMCVYVMCVCVCERERFCSKMLLRPGINIPILIFIIPDKCIIVWTAKPGIEF